jgi:ATP-dependent RNA helicase DDX20
MLFLGVDLVICLSPSYDIETHMHRVGRAGRYGGIGVAISILGNSEEADKLFRVMQKKSLDIRLLDLHKEFPYNLVEDTEFHARSVRFNVITTNST